MLVVQEMKKVMGSMTSHANTYLPHIHTNTEGGRQWTGELRGAAAHQVRYPRNPPCRDK